MSQDSVSEAEHDALATIAQVGGFWTGAERTTFAEVARSVCPRPLTSRPDLSALSLQGSSGVSDSPFALEVVTKIAIEAEQITAKWASVAIQGLGVGAYVELVSVVAITTALDRYRAALSRGPLPLQPPMAGEPQRVLADGIGDAGAHVPMLLDHQGPNVGRALSAVPQAQRLFFPLISTFYAAGDFTELRWESRALSRPQVGLVASRVSALNQCFY